ncbi:hypothetical protein FRC11_004946 [Ceratobasidium sp. 423]|nr:hypothetical protein FRC11_004946 [Ceratobasidium sp. 423]
MAASPKNKGRASKRAAKEVVEEHEEKSTSESEQEDEEGYEVEAILDAKWQYNKRGKWSYYVRWKGYGPEEDLWIDEEDAAGADDLIKEYHESNNLPRDGKGKKGPVKKGRPSATTVQKKRKASEDEMDVDQEEAPKKQTKRGRPSKAKVPEPKSEPEEEEEEEHEFASMDDYLKKARWDDLIKEIETVENTGSELIALITRADGQKSKVSTTVLAERCPQMLITFYETHLKWRPTDDD